MKHPLGFMHYHTEIQVPRLTSPLHWPERQEPVQEQQLSRGRTNSPWINEIIPVLSSGESMRHRGSSTQFSNLYNPGNNLLEPKYGKQGTLLAGTHSKPRTQLGTRETPLQEVTVLRKLSTQLYSLPRATGSNQRNQLYHSSSWMPEESLPSLTSSSSSGLGQSILFPSRITSPDSPSKSTFLAR